MGALGIFACAAPTWGQAVPSAFGTFGLRANGGPLHSVQSESSTGAEAGMVRFVGSAVDPAGAWEASWDYSADLDPNGNAKITGAATIVNKSEAAVDFDVVFEVPICPFIQSASKMGGACTIKLTTNQNGGAISTQGGNAVFTALADGGGGGKLFHGPFNMGSTGSGTAQTANVFGAPFPAMASAAVSERFGLRHVFKLTDGDTVLLTTNLVLGGDPANFVECAQLTAPAAAAAAPAAPAPAIAPSISPATGAPTTSAVTLGATSSNKVTIAHDSKTKRKASASRPKSSSAASQKSKAPAPRSASPSMPRRSPWSRR